MKRTICLCGILLCLLLISGCYEILPSEQTIPLSNEEQVYVKKYKDFLLNTDIDAGDQLPIRGYYLFDLNFDNIPELGVLHHSGGSMGGYFTYYRFDGNEIVAVLTDKNEPLRISDYTQILADSENEKVYLLREMYLLQGNVNGTYGYIKEIINQNGIPCVYDILSLEVNQESDLEKHNYKEIYDENGFLSDSELDDCLITQYNFKGKWNEISSDEYLKIKKELISEENDFMDLRDIDVYILLWGPTDELIDVNGSYKNIQIIEEEIDMLFLKWFKYIE